MRACLLLLLVIAMPGNAQEADPETFGRIPKESIHILPGELFDPSQAGHGLPDLGYPDRDPWQALVCHSQCTLEPVKLATHPVEVTPYDGEPLHGQTLALDQRPSGSIIALLRGLPAVKSAPDTRLRGDVARYAPSNTPGTLEIAIPGPEGARIVPRLARHVDGNGDTPVSVWLEMHDKRQQLGQLAVDAIVGYPGLATGTKLLRWAGDLDGDGKLDLIMSLSSRVGEQQSAILYLSSAATPGELVHAVARFEYFPVEDAGC